MSTRQLTTTIAPAAILVAGAILGAWLVAAPPAGALGNAFQLLTGGKFMSEGVTQWTSPDLATSHGRNFPATGSGEAAAQIRMPAGTLSALRVQLTTANPPSSGTFTLTVRVNGVNTLLTCQLAGTGECNGTANVTVASGARLAVRVNNNFVGTGDMAYTYTLLFN